MHVISIGDKCLYVDSIELHVYWIRDKGTSNFNMQFTLAKALDYWFSFENIRPLY